MQLGLGLTVPTYDIGGCPPPENPARLIDVDASVRSGRIMDTSVGGRASDHRESDVREIVTHRGGVRLGWGWGLQCATVLGVGVNSALD